MAEKANNGKAQPGPVRLYAGIRGMLVTAFFLLLIALAFGFFAARTESFRQWAERQIESKTGLPVSIGDSRVAFPYTLVLGDIRSAPPEGIPGGSLKIGEVRVSWLFPASLDVEVSDAMLSVVRMDNGKWDPSCFAAFGNMHSIDDIDAITLGLRERHIRLNVRHGFINWTGTDGVRKAYAEGLDFTMEPVKVGRQGRRLYYCDLSVYDVLDLDGTKAREVNREWFFTDTSEAIEIDYKERGDGGQPGQ